jgi:hypothetical protein
MPGWKVPPSESLPCRPCNFKFEIRICKVIPRDAAYALRRLALGFPVLALTGPRQSGKTTLARAEFAHKPYVSLENPQEREFAQSDPQRFLGRFAQGAVLDEVQRCPALLSWLQGLVDERRIMGGFVLTGSAQFDLLAGIAIPCVPLIARRNAVR